MTRILILPALLITVPAAAQDLSPVISTTEVARGQVVSATMMQHSKRIAQRNASSRRGTPGQIAACANKADFREDYGADHPKVQKLYSLCRGIGR